MFLGLWAGLASAEPRFTDQVTLRPELAIALDRPERPARSRIGFGVDVGWQKVVVGDDDWRVGPSYGVFARLGLEHLRTASLAVGTRTGAVAPFVANDVAHLALVGAELEAGVALARRDGGLMLGFAGSGPYAAARLSGVLNLRDGRFGAPAIALGPAIPVLPTRRDILLSGGEPPPTPRSTATEPMPAR